MRQERLGASKEDDVTIVRIGSLRSKQASSTDRRIDGPWHRGTVVRSVGLAIYGAPRFKWC